MINSLNLILSIFICLVVIGLFAGGFYLYNTRLGVYYRPGDIIVIRGDNSYQVNMYIASHEMAHKTYFKNLTAEQRAQWEALFVDDNTSTTLYGSSDPAEDFAESVAFNMQCHINKRIWLPDKAKQEFLQNISQYFEEI